MTHPKMDPELKQKWVAELRSGRWKQGYEQLQSTSDTYCCMGVLCRVAGVTEDRLRGINLDSINSTTGLLTKEVQNRLAWMNDQSRRNFNQIADWIEENL